MNKEEYNELTGEIIASAIEVHRELGLGLLESVYHICIYNELQDRNLKVKSQVALPVIYKGKNLNKDFLIDLLVENEIIVELKSVETLLAVHEFQLLTYLRLANKKLGLLINFNEPKLINGVRRKINGIIE